MASTLANVSFVSEDDDDDSLSSFSDSDIDGSDNDDFDTYVPEWQPRTAGPLDLSFTGNPGLKVPLPGLNQPVDYFFLLLDEQLLETIVQCTNAYALDVFCRPTTNPNSRITRWKDLTVDELKVFLSLLLHTGNIQLNRLQDYWKTDSLYDFGFFRKHMSRDRFMLILRCLHFSENDSENRDDRLYKIRSIVNYFNDKMMEVYSPGKELTIDEGMMLWRGRLVYRQYLKGKRHNGVKLYCLSESQGLTLRFMVYSGSNDDVVGEQGHTSKVVLKLVENYLNKGHSLYIDSFYTTFALAANLLTNKTYCTGTVRKDRRFVPNEIKNAKLKKGETVQRYSEGVCLAVWKDKRYVHYLSTEHDNIMVTIHNRYGQPREKPLPIIKYNSYMSGVDRVDQMMSYYPCDRMCLRWYKKVFVHITQMILVNAWAMHKEINPNARISLYDYRHHVIKALLPPDVPRPEIVSTRRRPNHVLSKNEERGKDNNRKRKRCRMCSQENKRSDTIYYCPSCPGEPGLCPTRCFDRYHESM